MLKSRIRSLLRRVGVGRSVQVDLTSIDPRGPVFISYRHSDGLDLATDTAWAFRSAGVPVWRDQSDLPPGDTNRRLEEALESGLSGAVLLVTPEARDSRALRKIEVPRLLQLATHRDFALTVLSAIEYESGELNFAAPDRLLGLPKGTLEHFMQERALSPVNRAAAARSHSQRRMRAVQGEVAAAGQFITLDVQTRIPPVAAPVDADLVVRLRPPTERNRRPNRKALVDLRAFLADLPQLMELAGARHVRVRGGAHLTAAFALGAALPTTLFGRVEVIDTGDAVWTLRGAAPASDRSEGLLRVDSIGPPYAATAPILVYLDLLPTPSDSAFNRLLDETSRPFTNAFHIRPTRSSNLNPEDAAALIGEASQTIRRLADDSQTLEVHLLLRCPWTLALLLGRTLNTFRVHLYEWEDGPDDLGSPAEPRYLPSLVVRSGAGGSPIEDVSLPPRETS